MSFLQINPIDCWNILQNKKSSVLVDVRTNPELIFVGVADLSEIQKETIYLPWKNYPEMNVNENFSSDLIKVIQENFSEFQKEDIDIFFMCKVGGRSLEAAKLVSELGFKCYNITGGFEGEIDENSHRAKINGWKAENLPWRQN